MYLVIKKNHLLIAFALIIILIFGLVLTTATPASVPANAVVVALDAGHGDMDGGASGGQTGVKESEINLKIVLYLKALLENAGIEVILTRDDEGILDGKFIKNKDMAERRRIIEESNCNMMVSVHLNTFPDPSVRGAQAFYLPDNEEGKILANDIQEVLNRTVEPFRPRTATARDYYMLRITVAASVIVECGFLSSPEDERLLRTAVHQQTLALAIFSGMMRYLSVTANT